MKRIARFWGECPLCLELGHLLPLWFYDTGCVRACFGCRTGGAK